MSQAAKKRDCPVVGREIRANECGEWRNNRHVCPAECPHNPFAPANYPQVMEIEAALDAKCELWLLDHAEKPFRETLAREMAKPTTYGRSVLFHWFLFFKRDAGGLTCAERWEKNGFPGFKNDERALMRAKMKVRVILAEAHRIMENGRTEVVDLLDPGAAPVVIQDFAMARSMVRFGVFIAYTYPLPHYWRVTGLPGGLPDLEPFDALEVTSHLIRHLGGPADTEASRLWLAEHFARFWDAAYATSLARKKLMIESMDLQFGKAVYEVKAPALECLDRLDAIEDVDDDNLQDAERREGFTEARVWFLPKTSPGHHLNAVLGRVLIGPTYWRVEAMGAARLATLRQALETQLGERLRFSGERRDDLDSHFQQDYDAALVPPALLAHPPKLLIGSSRVKVSAAAQTKEQSEAEANLSLQRDWLENSVPALDDHTPREAARDPLLRPRLIKLVKSRVRATDERNLETGHTDDINWMLKELDLHEILFDAPPPRARLQHSDTDEPGEEDPLALYKDRPALPPMPDRPLTVEEAMARASACIDMFPSSDDAIDELEASGATLLRDSHELTKGLLTEDDFALLVPALLSTWFAVIPVGQTPILDFKSMKASFVRDLQRLSDSIPSGGDILPQIMDECPQPGLAMAAIVHIQESNNARPTKSRSPSGALIIMALAMKSIITELDRISRIRKLR